MPSQNEIFRFPDTGQNSCYDKNAIEIPIHEKDNELFGQDGCFELNPQSFTKLDVAGNEIPDVYNWDDGFRMVRDNNTGLVWEVKSPYEDDINFCEALYSWNEAPENFIKKLNDAKYGGFNDWRMPRKDELRSILDYGRINPAIDIHFFPNTQRAMYLCSETYNMQDYFAWTIFFGFGSATAVSKESPKCIRAVRGGYNDKFGVSDYDRFKDNGDGTITDSVTGLMWQKGENPRMSWYDALKAAKEMELAGYKDWRLPNIKELNTILNLKYEGGWWYFKKFFPAEGLEPPLLHYFSSTSHENYFAWVTNFCFGYDGYYANKNATLLFRAVRNIQQPIKEEKIFHFPDTGQLKCYDDMGNIINISGRGDKFFGQDGNYIVNQLSFTKLRESGKPISEEAVFIDGLRMVKDNNTGLIWEVKSPFPDDINFNGEKYTWEQAQTEFIDKLNKNNYGGFSDWRLPNKEELRTIVNYDGMVPAIDKDYFDDFEADFYWSKDPYMADDKLAWGVYFAYGCGICYLKNSQYPARAVRGGYNRDFGDMEKYNFIDNDDGTISDPNTNLMWMKGEPDDMSWEDALKFCENLELAGHKDWRLPNLKELATLLKLSFEDAAWHDKKYFPDVKTKPLGFYWCSTTFSDTFAWGINFQFGYDGYYAGKKTGVYAFRPVRSL